VRLDTPAEAAQDLVTRFTRLRLRAQADIRLCTDLVAVTCEESAPDPRHADLPRRLIIEARESQLAPPMEAASWNRMRIQCGVPEWGEDYRAEEIFPTDVNLDVMNGIDYKKGCFIGQEVASRMKRKGGIRKRTLRISGRTVETGRVLTAPNEIGTITSAEGEDALAIIRIDRLAKVKEPILCEGEPVTLHIPDWLDAEIAAFKGDGNVTV
jgi:tRNA-modifying protein YgfZ